MNRVCFAIPGRLNLVIAAIQFVALCSILWGSWTGPPVGIRFSAFSGIRDRHEFRLRDVA